MGRMLLYLTIISVLLLGCHLIGFIKEDETPNSALLKYLIKPESFEKIELTSTLLTGIAGIVTVGLALVVGYLTGRPDLSVATPIAVLMAGFIWDVIIIYTHLKELSSIAASISLLVFSPLILLCVISAFEWWRMQT